MRRPYGAESHVTGATIVDARDQRPVLSIHRYALYLVHGAENWTNGDVAEAFGVRREDVTGYASGSPRFWGECIAVTEYLSRGWCRCLADACYYSDH